MELNEQQLFEINAKADELAKKYGVSHVHVYLNADNSEDPVVGFIKEPTYAQKLMALDKLTTSGPMLAGEELRQSLVLAEESDQRVLVEDRYKLGMATTCITILEVAQNDFKKK